MEPTFSVLIDTTEKVIGPLIEEDRKARETGNRRSRYCSYYCCRFSDLFNMCIRHKVFNMNDSSVNNHNKREATDLIPVFGSPDLSPIEICGGTVHKRMPTNLSQLKQCYKV